MRFATFRGHAAPDRERLARELRASPAIEHVLLETCHRVELASVEDDPHHDGQLSGRDAIRRVFEVVAGFDSAVVAEEQLLGQARGAYEAALAAGTTGPILNELFQRALRFGRSVRSHARPGSDRSLADLGAGWLEEHLPQSPATTLVAGTGEMGRIVGHRLAAGGHRVIVASGSAERGGRLVDQLEGEGHQLHVGPLTRGRLDHVDAMVLAVRDRGAIVQGEQLGSGRPWVLDLSTPSVVDAEAATVLGERLLTIDALAVLGGGRRVLTPAIERRLRAELVAEVESFIEWLDVRGAADALRLLHTEAEAVRRRHLDRLRTRGDLDDRQLAAVEAAATAMVGELMHGPTVALRRGGADADTVRRLFGLES